MERLQESLRTTTPEWMKVVPLDSPFYLPHHAADRLRWRVNLQYLVSVNQADWHILSVAVQDLRYESALICYCNSQLYSVSPQSVREWSHTVPIVPAELRFGQPGLSAPGTRIFGCHPFASRTWGDK